MAEQLQSRPVGWGRTARYGAEAGAALALVYALVFIGYAAARSGLALLATPDADGGLLRTMLATWLALALPALAIGMLAALPASAAGALTALLLRVVLSGLGAARTAGRGAAVAGGTCLAISLALLGLVVGRIGLAWSPAVAETLLFWLIVPLAVYTAAGGVAGGRMARMLRAGAAR